MISPDEALEKWPYMRIDDIKVTTNIIMASNSGIKMLISKDIACMCKVCLLDYL